MLSTKALENTVTCCVANNEVLSLAAASYNAGT
jgi:hypothetical protein